MCQGGAMLSLVSSHWEGRKKGAELEAQLHLPQALSFGTGFLTSQDLCSHLKNIN